MTRYFTLCGRMSTLSHQNMLCINLIRLQRVKAILIHLGKFEIFCKRYNQNLKYTRENIRRFRGNLEYFKTFNDNIIKKNL